MNEYKGQPWLLQLSEEEMNRLVAFYAEKMCITPKYLSVVELRASHRKPSDWIRDYVILDAKALILSGDYSIRQVSNMLHFANPSFFGEYFKDAVGCSLGKFADFAVS